MSYVCPISNTRSPIDFLSMNYEAFTTEESFKCCVLLQLLAGIVDGCKRYRTSTAAPGTGVPSRATEATTASPGTTTTSPGVTAGSPGATSAPLEATTDPAEVEIFFAAPRLREEDTVQVIQHLLGFSDPI